MASASFQIARTGLQEVSLVAGSDLVAEGTAAPTTANNLEVRVDLAGSWTDKEVRQAMQLIWQFLTDPSRSTSIPKV